MGAQGEGRDRGTLLLSSCGVSVTGDELAGGWAVWFTMLCTETFVKREDLTTHTDAPAPQV